MYTKCVINNPEAREALSFWKDLYLKYKIMPNPMNINISSLLELSGITTGELQKFFLGISSVEECLQAIERQINALLS